MRDVTSECIEFKSDCTFYGLVDELWSGAKERWQEADEETRIAVWDRVKEWVEEVSYDGHIPTITQINDIIWFECDDLFYPPSFTVKVYMVDADDEMISEDPLVEKEFSGLNAEDDAREWWENKSSELSGVKAFLCNETDDSEEEL